MADLYMILSEMGPTLSSDLKKALEAKGLSASAAAKRLQRAQPPIRRLEEVRFRSGDRLHFLEGQEEAVGVVLRRLGRQHGIAAMWPLEVLDATGGAIEAHRFRVIAAAPRGAKGHLSDVDIAKSLVADKLLEEIGISGRGKFLALTEAYSMNPTMHRRIAAKSLAGSVLRDAVADWARRNAIVSHDSVKVRRTSEDPEVGYYGWDITAPCYLWPFAARLNTAMKHGYFVCDVFMEVGFSSYGYFLSKLDSISNNPRNLPLLPMIVSPTFSSEAHKKFKQRGVIVTTPDALIGKGTGRALLRLVEILSNAASVLADPKRGPEVFEVLSEISRIEGSSQNLRGALFELITAHCVRERSPGGFLDLGVRVKDPNTGSLVTDIDVFYRQKRDVRAIECKGHSANTVVDDTEVDSWLRKLGKVRQWIVDEYNNPNITFEFWTTGSFTESARQKLNEASTRTKKYIVKFQDLKDIEREVTETSSGASHLLNLFREHFSRHPLAKAAPAELPDLVLPIGWNDIDDPPE